MKNSVLIYGVGGGALTFVITILLNKLLGASGSMAWLNGVITYGLLFAIIFLGGLASRKENGNVATFNQAFGWTAKVVLYAALTVGVLTYVYYTFDEGARERMIEETTKVIEEKEMSSDQAEMTLKMTEMMANPLALMLASICSYGVIGLIFAVIASAILKREDRNIQNFEKINS